MHARRWILAPVLVALVAIGLGVLWSGGDGQRATALPEPGNYRRIVSLSPSITECLFALGLGERVVGVTDFCEYPPEAQSRSKVGGYYDLNYEAIVALRPDLVVCLPEHAEYVRDLGRLGLLHLTVDHRQAATILESLKTIGRTCGASERAEALVRELRRRIETVQRRAIDERRPRVLVCVGRNLGSPTIDEVYIAGRRSFYDGLITLAGGVNVYDGPLAFPRLTGEGLLRLQPEIIIDTVTDPSEDDRPEAEVLQQWNSLADLPAVQQKRVFLFQEDFAVIPGPRFVQILEKMAAIIHPEGVAR
jgi:iron complex transport system substrate-binding protein